VSKVAEQYDICEALDAVEEDVIEILQTSILRGAKPNVLISKTKLSNLRNNTNCSRSQDLEKAWRRTERLSKTGGKV